MTTKKVSSKKSVNNVQLVKISLPKKHFTVNIDTDLGMSDYPGVQFVMWADPSVRTIARILTPLAKERDEITEDDGDAYFDALNEVFLDTNIDGIELGTLENIIDAYDHPHLPYGFIGMVASLYCSKLITESQSLKKVFGLSEDQESSGSDSATKG